MSRRIVLLQKSTQYRIFFRRAIDLALRAAPQLLLLLRVQLLRVAGCKETNIVLMTQPLR